MKCLCLCCREAEPCVYPVGQRTYPPANQTMLVFLAVEHFRCLLTGRDVFSRR